MAALGALMLSSSAAAAQSAVAPAAPAPALGPGRLGAVRAALMAAGRMGPARHAEGQRMDPQEIFMALLGPDGMADPYPLYAALHEHGEVIQAGTGFVLVPGYESASAVLRDPEYRVDDAESFDQAFPGWRDHPALSADGLLNLNGQEHTPAAGADGPPVHPSPGPGARAGDRSAD